MSLALKALDGALKDKVFKLKDGLTIGRQGTDIALNDPKVSSLHAKIHKTESGWALHDNDSKNGVRVGDDRLAILPLKVKQKFEIGGHHFIVVDLEPAPKAAAALPLDLPKLPEEPKPMPVIQPVEDNPPATKVQKFKPHVVAEVKAPESPLAQRLKEQAATVEPAPAKPVKKKAQKFWHEALSEFLDAYQNRFTDKPKPATALEPAVVLEFVKGVQVNSKWTLGYGPRKIGATSLDLPICEPGAPAICFELHPTMDGILFSTKHPEQVKINGQSVDSKLLHMGDTIQILETLIEVDFST